MKEYTADDSFQQAISTSKKHRLSSIPTAESQSIHPSNELIRLMNAFVDEHGSITEDEYFRVL